MTLFWTWLLLQRLFFQVRSYSQGVDINFSPDMLVGIKEYVILVHLFIQLQQVLVVVHGIFPEKAMAPHSSTFAWKIPWTEEPGRLQSVVAKSRTRLSNFTFPFHFHALEREMATHSSVLAWRIPGMGEPGGLPSMGSHRVGHDWSDLAAAAAWDRHCVFEIFCSGAQLL